MTRPSQVSRAILMLTAVPLAAAMAQGPPIPGWLDRASPSEYALLERELPAGMSLPTGIEAEAKAMALGYTDAQGNFVRQDSYVLNVTEKIAVEGDDPGSVSLYVAVLGSPEQTIAFAREHFQYGMNPDWMVNGNDLGDARLGTEGGSVKGPGRVIIRYRDVLASFSWLGRIDDYGTAKTEQVARLWLDKVAGPPGADLSLHPDRIVLKLWSDHNFIERETAADKQHVLAQIRNNSQNVVAQGVQARLSVQMPGEDEYAPLQIVNLGTIAPGASSVATFEWDLKGEQVTLAGLLVDAWAEGPRDTNPMDNQAGLEVSIYYAHNGNAAYRWREDSYSFKNYSYDDDDFAAMVQMLLGTIVGEAYTDAQAGELLSRMLFPQTYMRLVDYLHTSVTSGAGGHCYGMSATAGLYFMDGSLRPGGASTAALSRDAADPNIKLYQRAQMVPIARALINGDKYFERHFSSLSCLNIVRRKLRDERKPVILSMGGTVQVGQETKGWGHAVMAYKLVEINGRDSAIYVYDPNIAPAAKWNSHAPMSAFHIDPDDGGWNTSSDMSAIYDSNGSTLTALAAREVTREISVAESNAIMPDLMEKLREMAAFLEKTNKVMAVLGCPADAYFTDQSAQGRRTGYINGQRVNEIPGAEIRTTGEVEIYILPAGEPLTVTITGTDRGVANFDIIRPENGNPAITSFLDMPVRAGIGLCGTLAPGGEIATLTDGRARHAPTLTGSLAGDRVTWQQPAGPAPTPTPAGAPTATLVICRGHNDGEPFGITDAFGKTGAVYGVLTYTNQPPATVERIWMREGKVVTRGESRIEGDGWAWGWLHTDKPRGLQAGAYELIWKIGNHVIARKAFTVGGAPTAPAQPAAPAPAPAPAASDAEIIVCRDVVDGKPVGAGTVFADAAKIMILHRYRDQAAGTAEASWFRNGALLTRSERQIKGGNGWVSFSVMGGGGASLATGEYEVRLSLPGRTLSTSFTVGGAQG